VVVSSSRNCAAVLAYAGIANLIDTRVDGETAQDLHLAGKPAPDAFPEAARRHRRRPGNGARPHPCRPQPLVSACPP
jgi:beta-phosphoglucomutase-like phosphatase (HAD superfamily)